MKIILIDNADSFTYILKQTISNCLGKFDFIEVVKYSEVVIDKIEYYDIIVISPGPGHPKDYFLYKEIYEKYKEHKTFLGICLGMQIMAYLEGMPIYQMQSIVHGHKDKLKIIESDSVFENIDIYYFEVGLYHSWAVEFIKEKNYKLLATTENNTAMIMKSVNNKNLGLQFHPESFLTNNGTKLISNFLKLL